MKHYLVTGYFVNKEDVKHYNAAKIWGDASIDLLFREKTHNNLGLAGLSGYSICKDEVISFSYSEAQAIVNKTAEHLLFSGLNSGDILAVQLPNSVETQLLYLACWQQDITVAAMPSNWRKRDVEQALIRISPQGYIAAKIHDGFNFDELMFETAFNISSIRQLFSLGGSASDGCIALDPCFDVQQSHNINLLKPEDLAINNANGACFISFAKNGAGVNMPFYHTHNHLIAAANISMSLMRLDNQTKIINPFCPTSISTIVLSLIVWTLSNADLHCVDGIIATEFQDMAFKKAVLLLPKTFDEPALVDALFEQGLAKLVMLDKIQVQHLSSSDNADIIDILSVGEYGFIPFNRQKIETPIKPRQYDYFNENNDLLDGISLSVNGDYWQLSCSFMPLNCVTTELNILTDININANPNTQNLHIGSMNVNFLEIEQLLINYPGVDDVAVLVFKDKLMISKPVIAIVPKLGAVILQHEVVNYLKERKVAHYKIPNDLFKIPAIPRDHQGKITRATSREKLLKLVGPVKVTQGDNLVNIQQELATLLANA